MIVLGVAALDQGLDAIIGEGSEFHAVPAQAIAEHVVSVLGPDAPSVFGAGHGLAGGAGEEPGARQGAAEGGQVRGAGVEAAGAHDAQAVLAEGPGVLGREIGLHKPGDVKVLLGGEGAFKARGGQDVPADIGGEVQAGHRLHHQLRQGEAVIAVDAVGPRIGLEPLGGQPLQQVLGGGAVRVVKEEGVGLGGTHEAGGVVQEHPHGDLLVPLVRHFELGQVPGDGGVQLDAALFHQLHHRHGGVDLAHGADAVQIRVQQHPVLGLGVDAAVARQGDLPVLPHRILDAGGAAVLHGVARGLGGGLLPGEGGGVLGQGRHCQAQAQAQAQSHGRQAAFPCLSHFLFLSRPVRRALW